MADKIDPAKVPSVKLPSGTKIPCIGMGTFGSDRYSPDEVSAAVGGAIRLGYRLFDCASVYGNEDLIGEVFDDAFKSGVVKREELFITSKVWNDMHARGDVLLALAKTLRDLKLDYVDAYFVHWPFPNYHAPHCDGDARNPDSVPFSADQFMRTWEEMEKIHRLGLAKHICMSNMTIPKFDAVLSRCKVKPALIEMELHPAFQQSELFDYCVKHNITPIGYCPIGSPNRPDRDKTPGDVIDTELPEVAAVAKAHNIHPALVCLKWQVQRGSIPIPFSVHEKNYASNLAAVIGDPLTDAEMASIAKADKNCRLVKGQVFLWPGAKGWEDLWDLDGTITK
ncbi:aldo/keto reductase [Leadbettera azotonutricia]|uniref:Alcohol dehydrogenase [NADP+] (Aldehyde reductase) (Aldo-keto reductase family 1 member a1) n=1 Tax=Leadbettera azotonutricia (strain ATCC BAA-888 / DSM 13862 / ZAS-9) TaxID=545695 RepID=F5YF91_LEAAZ|nr:aldo/keto reductase [Leadbettera azotonutricia]AEF82256.1 alcohol dehydrogenase [NADP+] (aldehyde reductase) (aldo-keto reductase family 1 member a1) [Leadbettera azotonutricia ZAS-9]